MLLLDQPFGSSADRRVGNIVAISTPSEPARQRATGLVNPFEGECNPILFTLPKSGIWAAQDGGHADAHGLGRDSAGLTARRHPIIKIVDLICIDFSSGARWSSKLQEKSLVIYGFFL